MFVNKLTRKQAMQIFALLQVVIGIIYYFIEKGNFRYIFLAIFVILGLVFFLCSLIKRTSNEKSSWTLKWQQIFGILLTCCAILQMINKQSIDAGLIPLDCGLMLLLIPIIIWK